MVGKVLGNRYRVLREVGSGGMAWVYLAEDIKENRLVAVKVLYPQFGEDLSYIHRFNREAKLASAMTDPHIVRVLDYGADRDIYYLVMEYIEGRDLREMMAEKSRFPWRQALDILDQLATALEHAHIHGVVHRDIKPQNLMLDDSGMLKVLDFGIARISALPSLTQSGFIGSPYYVSPEQAMSEEVDIRSDIYSAGIVFYELLSGNIPFDAKSPWSIISQHIANVPPPIHLEEEDAPESVHQVLNRMVAKQREERFQTPTALRRAISATLAGKPLPDDALDTRPIGGPAQIDMAESLFHRALEAIEAEEWARATDLLNQTLKLNPQHAQAQEKLTLAERYSTLISKYSTAVRAMERKAWQECIEKFKAIIELEPHYRDAQALLEECQWALEQENKQHIVTDRYVEGVSHFESERWREALESFQEVQQFSPGYKRVEEYLSKAERLSRPTVWQRLIQAISQPVTPEAWGRWGLIGVSLVAIILTIGILGNGTPATGNDDPKEQLKRVYDQAQQAISQNDTQQAITLLEQILSQDPDYADAAELRRDLIIALTPIPAATPSPTLAPPQENPLVGQLAKAEDTLELGMWPEVIEILQTMQEADPEFETSRVSSLLCDAYIGRGIDSLLTISEPDNDEVELVSLALADFEAGVEECPRRIDLQDQTERATTYLQALNTSAGDYEALIKTLNPIVAADPDYADGNAKNLLYHAYLNRGKARNEAGEIVGALGDYEAALALNVDDPAEVQTRRAELILSFQQPGEVVAQTSETPQPSPTPVTNDNQNNPPANPTPTSEPIQAALEKPTLLDPANDLKFAGKFDRVVLEWEPIEELAADEYYDLTIMHIFAEQPTYWGLATEETEVQLVPANIGVGKAGNDRFYWWVTVRKRNSAPSAGALDVARSPESEIRTFVWTP